MSTSEKNTVITTALARYQRALEADKENRAKAVEDVRFVMGEQWPEEIKKARESDGRPCITINRAQQMVKQVVNDMRQNRAAIKVLPASDGASQETAALLSDIIRALEAESNASDLYTEAGNNAVQGGIGYIRILPEYTEGGFDQTLRIRWVKDPSSVLYGDYEKPDGSDAKYCFIVDDMLMEEFKAQYPQADTVPFPAEDLNVQDWVTDKTMRVAEYFEVREMPDTLYLLQDGSTVRKSQMPDGKEPPKEFVLRSRSAPMKQCVWRKITAKEVLEETVYSIPFLLVIPCIGESYVADGKTYRMGLVRHMIDPARVYNYARTATTEQVALAPRAPYVMAEGQEEGHKAEWAAANTKNYAYLLYKPTTVAGQLVPKPERQQFAGVPAGAMADLQLASDEIKAVTGIYDAALGQKSNETSGKAILARQRESDNATYHYVDAVNRMIRQCGRVLVKLIPIVMDVRRVVTALGEDGKDRKVEINGDDPVGNILRGDYDAVISTGASYETKRVEAANSMTEFMQAVPNAAPLIADLVAKNMDWVGAEQIAKRLQFTLPPEIRQAEAQEEGQQLPPEVIGKLQEQQQVIQGLQQHMQQALEKIQTLEAGHDIEERRLEIEQYNAETARKKEEREAQLAGKAESEALIRARADVAISENEALAAMATSKAQGLEKLITTLEQKVDQLLALEGNEPKEEGGCGCEHETATPLPPINITVERDAPAGKVIRITAPSGEVYAGVISGSEPPEAGEDD